MKKVFFAIVLILLATNASALELNKLDIEINVDDAGFAKIVENYSIKFMSPFEKNDFSVTAIENSSSIQSWQADLEFFSPKFAHNILELSPTPPAKISYDQEAEMLTFEYSLRERFATLESEGQRSDFFVIDDKQLFTFLETSTIVIPENTSIRIRLPQSAEIDASRLPEKVSIIGNVIQLSGIQSNSISIKYRIVKPIAPTSGELIENISDIYVILGPILIVLLIGLFIKKEELEEKIEKYLVDHSEIKTRQTEEISLDLDENL